MLKRLPLIDLEFWVTNVSNRNVSLRDLGITIPAGNKTNPRHINLLDRKHYNFTPEQLEKSAKDGSLFAKSNFIKLRINRPEPLVQPGIYVEKTIRKGRYWSLVKVEERNLSELIGEQETETDEQFAMNFILNEESNTEEKAK